MINKDKTCFVQQPYLPVQCRKMFSHFLHVLHQRKIPQQHMSHVNLTSPRGRGSDLFMMWRSQRRIYLTSVKVPWRVRFPAARVYLCSVPTDSSISSLTDAFKIKLHVSLRLERGQNDPLNPFQPYKYLSPHWGTRMSPPHLRDYWNVVIFMFFSWQTLEVKNTSQWVRLFLFSVKNQRQIKDHICHCLSSYARHKKSVFATRCSSFLTFVNWEDKFAVVSPFSLAICSRWFFEALLGFQMLVSY